MSPLLQRAIEIAALALRFARVERVTRHEDGVRPETDSDHTVMLAILACDLCPPDLNRGRVAEFAIVHDLLEAETGDVQTLTIDAAGRAAKKERERVAMRNFLERFGATSWLGSTMIAYEAQREPEARFVRLLDKVTPKLTHALNGCCAAKALTDQPGFVQSHRDQYATFVASDGYDPMMAEALELLAESMDWSERVWDRA